MIHRATQDMFGPKQGQVERQVERNGRTKEGHWLNQIVAGGVFGSFHLKIPKHPQFVKRQEELKLHHVSM